MRTLPARTGSPTVDSPGTEHLISGSELLKQLSRGVFYVVGITVWIWFADAVLFDDDDLHLWPMVIGVAVIWILGTLLESYVTSRRARVDH